MGVDTIIKEKARPPLDRGPFHQLSLVMLVYFHPRPIVGVGRGSILPDTVLY